MNPQPEEIQAIGDEIAIRWSDASESYYPMSYLREHSPSAENQGEPDVLGRRIGGRQGADYSGVRVKDWQMVGGYAIQFFFDDGHSTGLYTYQYLKDIAPAEP